MVHHSGVPSSLFRLPLLLSFLESSLLVAGWIFCFCNCYSAVQRSQESLRGGTKLTIVMDDL
jgi:hypothetical protein